MQTRSDQREAVKARVNWFLLRIANILTITRLLATPLLVYLLLQTVDDPSYYWRAFALVVFLQATDVLDGYLARQAKGTVRERINPTGEVLDPIADKLYIDSAFVTLAVIGRVEIWLAGLVVARDVLILLGWTARFLFSGIRLLPNVIGKMADTSQAVLLAILLLRLGPAVETPFLWIAAGLTVLSGLAYAKMALAPPAEMRS